jgi:hypothetical protein
MLNNPHFFAQKNILALKIKYLKFLYLYVFRVNMTQCSIEISLKAQVLQLSEGLRIGEVI